MLQLLIMIEDNGPTSPGASDYAEIYVLMTAGLLLVCGIVFLIRGLRS